MTAVDRFVFLDDVQLARQSWQTRNRILTKNTTQWISVPVRHLALKQTIRETEIVEDRRWRAKLCSNLRQCYARHPFGHQLEILLEEIAAPNQTTLSELNIGLIQTCTEQLAIRTPVFRTSRLPIKESDRTQRLVAICHDLGCHTYVSPPGSADYLEADGFDRQSDIALEFVAYNPPFYAQHGSSGFVSHLSIIDVVANLGWNGAASYVRTVWPDTPVSPPYQPSIGK